ncbi:GNAT family N-acetyltransferase [Shewanella insulae]|uniref:GNAT family N-acetyltransferase n=1 Tax=Shewanella insulae TaxID=2681496 RepID=A0A6L7HVX5_9GAMM|nr:GNAT family N-acetyltransferase [Shewanella insulae]MCG9711591.1 GNAT family N-acetyltransferase [Shewanella insulae]MCG9755079.1 GNAT family N-acetyltransferase [Shewanella insulae]MXR68466.1 GNAT family N-acetyltransferase [Shewanella insulae]
MLIRIAIEDDLTQLAPLFDRYRQSLGQAPALVESGEFLQARLYENDSVIFIAQLAQDIVGFIQLYPSFSSRLLKPVWYFDDLYVEEAFRHQGIATRLVEKARELADETGVMAVRRDYLSGDGFVFIDDWNTRALFAEQAANQN